MMFPRLALAIALLLFPVTANAARSITLPFTESFDTTAYQADLLYINGGATETHVTSGCWSGGCSKITPPTNTEGNAAALGAFTGISARQLNIRFLMKVGSTWYSTAEDKGEGLGDKLVIVTKTANSERVITGLLTDSHIPPATSPYPFGLVQCGTDVGNYTSSNNHGGISPCDGIWPSSKHADAACVDAGGGYDTFHIGKNIATDYDEQWVSVEIEAIAGSPNKIYLSTIDGTFNDTLYVTSSVSSDSNPWTSITHIGGYYNQYHPSPDSNTYMMLDELKIATSHIGPPAGFVEGGTTAPTISNLSPSGAQSCTSDPRNVTESLTTSEAATCRAHDTATTWANMTQMSTTGGTSHSRTVSRACGVAYSPNVICRDATGNESAMSEWAYQVGNISAKLRGGHITKAP